MLTRFCFLKIPIASIVTTQRCRVALESSVFLELLPIEETKALLASNSESGLNRIAPPPSQITEQRSLASSHNCAGVIHAAIIVVPGRLFAVVQLSYAYIITPHPLPSSLYTQPTCAFAFTSRSRGYRCKYKKYRRTKWSFTFRSILRLWILAQLLWKLFKFPLLFGIVGFFYRFLLSGSSFALKPLIQNGTSCCQNDLLKPDRFPFGELTTWSKSWSTVHHARLILYLPSPWQGRGQLSFHRQNYWVDAVLHQTTNE